MDWISYIAIVGSAMFVGWLASQVVRWQRRRRWQQVRQLRDTRNAERVDLHSGREMVWCAKTASCQLHGAHTIGDDEWCPGYGRGN